MALLLSIQSKELYGYFKNDKERVTKKLVYFGGTLLDAMKEIQEYVEDRDGRVEMKILSVTTVDQLDIEDKDVLEMMSNSGIDWYW